MPSTRLCLNCSSEETLSKSSKYCSAACKRAYRLAHPPQTSYKQTQDQVSRGVKTCSRCKEELLTNLFGFVTTKYGSQELGPRCKSCMRKLVSSYQATQHWTVRSARDLHRLYGLSVIQYLMLHDLQKGRCGICQQSESKNGHKLAVDHCHRTGEIRGLLCSKCNMILGQIDDSSEWLLAASRYLEEMYKAGAGSIQRPSGV